MFLLFQFHRVVTFSRLLESYPYSRDHIISEALTDVCPLVRGEVWAALLGVKVGGWRGSALHQCLPSHESGGVGCILVGHIQ